MKEFKDLTGQVFGKFTVLERDYSRTDRTYWWSQCSCINKSIKSVAASELLKGGTVSCGCFKIENAIEKFQKCDSRNVVTKYKIGATMSDIFPFYKRLFLIHTGMRVRCNDKKAINYEDYGGRGIKVCDEWLDSFMYFYSWAIHNGYADDLSIDRIDANGNYEPNNCRWATHEEQDYNKRNTLYLVIDGESKNIFDWMKISGLSYSVLSQRYKSNKPKTREIMFRPPIKIIKVIYNEKEITLRQLSEEIGIDFGTLRWRYQQGLRDKELIKPTRKNSKVETREEVLTIG